MTRLFLFAASLLVSLSLAADTKSGPSKGVCVPNERVQVAQCSVSELESLLDDPCFERHFESEKDRDQRLAEAIVAVHNEISAREHRPAERGEIASIAFSMRVKGELMKSRLIKALPGLPSADPNGRLLSILGATGDFAGLLPSLRRLIAAEYIWTDRVHATSVGCSLSSFLSLFHQEFSSFQDSLSDIKLKVAEHACVEVLLGIGCAHLSGQARQMLLDSMASLFEKRARMVMACSLRDDLLPGLSIADILKVIQSRHPFPASIVTNVLEHSPEHQTANWCMRVLNRPALPLTHTNPQPYLLFSAVFLKKYDISDDEQSELLRSCRGEDLLRSLPSDTTLLDTPALVKWVNGQSDPSVLPLPALVTLYSLDDDPSALRKYFKSPLKGIGPLAFATIALRASYAQRLKRKKMIDVLLRLDVARLADCLVLLVGKDRRALVAKIVSSLGPDDAKALAECISDSDFSLWVEACLDCPGGCETHWPQNQRDDLAAQTLVQYVGSDTSKLANLRKLPKEYRIMVFLLTKCDSIADYLSKSLHDEDVMSCLSRIRCASQEEASRAARRAHAHRLCQSERPQQ